MIPAERSHLLVVANTHPGMSGKNNEDRYAISAYRLKNDRLTPVVFAIVSDGIGGHRAGEVAAEIVVEKISQAIADSDASTPIPTLREAIQNASQAVWVQSQIDLKKTGMGATCACAWIIDDRLYIAYVGDSRIYLIHNGTILQLSKDHTWIQEAIDAGILNAENVQSHPNAHVIRRYLGSKQPTQPDTRLYLASEDSDGKAESNQGMRLSSGDQIILCSDGLTDLVSSDEILAAFTQADHEQALKRLTSLANQRGGHDNITIVALEYQDIASSMAKTIPIAIHTPRHARRKRWAYLLVFVLLGWMSLFLVGGYFYLKHGIPIHLSSTELNTTSPAYTNALPSAPPLSSATPSSVLPSTSPFPVITSTTILESKPIQVTITAWPTNTPIP